MSKNWKKYERDIAQLFSKWWLQLSLGGPDLKKDVRCFGRSPCSGGWATRHSAHRAGSDLIATKKETEELFPFCVELKDRKGWSFDRLLLDLTGSPGTCIQAWWTQTVTDADREGKVPLLVFHRECTSHNFIMYDADTLESLMPYVSSRARLRHYVINRPEKARGRQLVICSLFNWLQHFPSEAVRKWVEDKRKGSL